MPTTTLVIIPFPSGIRETSYLVFASMGKNEERLILATDGIKFFIVFDDDTITVFTLLLFCFFLDIFNTLLLHQIFLVVPR